MTPSERAQFLIKEVGYEKAEAHATWVCKGAVKQVTRDYWKEVVNLIQGAQYDAYEATVKTHCLICDAAIEAGSEYCSDCKSKTQ